jgi:hypothetical protein
VSYEAVITKIVNIRPHPKGDFIKLGSVLGGLQVVVGLNTVEGQLGVFFNTDGRLSPEFLKENDLVPRFDPITHERIGGGFFDERGKVRAQKFRGEKSEGFWCELDSLKWTGYKLDRLQDGDKFTELNGKLVCEKYFTPKTLKTMKNKLANVAKKYNLMFKENVDVKQFAYEVSNIKPGSIIYYTSKLHGSSGRFCNVLDEQRLNAAKQCFNRQYRKIERWFKLPLRWSKHICFTPKYEWTHLNGSRHVILEKRTGVGFYGKETFRTEATKNLVLHKGETLYFELVGYTDTGATIMQSQSTKELKDKTISKMYGDTMTYKYGCLPGQCRLYVYRITHTNEDGVAIELPWVQVKARCKELGLNPVLEIGESNPMVFNGLHRDLQQYCDSLIEGPSLLDSSHIREGVVLRIESPDGRIYFLKHKSFIFRVLEGLAKEDENYLDLEETS